MTCGNNCAGCDCKTEAKAATPYEPTQATEDEQAVENWHKNALALLMRYRAIVTLASQFNDGDLDLALNAMDDINSTETQFVHHLLNVPVQPVQVEKESVNACCDSPETCTKVCFRVQGMLRKQVDELKVALAAKPAQPNAILWPTEVRWNSSSNPIIGNIGAGNVPVVGIAGVNDLEVSNTSLPSKHAISAEKFAETKAVQAFTGLPSNASTSGNNRST